jgi:hypothetical protein
MFMILTDISEELTVFIIRTIIKPHARKWLDIQEYIGQSISSAGPVDARG